MNIAIISENPDLSTKLKNILSTFKENKHYNILHYNYDYILNDFNNIDAFIFNISNQIVLPIVKKNITIITKHSEFIPIAVIGDNILTNLTADFYIPLANNDIQALKLSLLMIQNYYKKFNKVKQILVKSREVIKIDDFSYDPIKRIVYNKDTQLQKLSNKEGKIFELLLNNYNTVLNKDIIMQRVWNKNDYFIGRSMDVYITHLRNMIKKHIIPIEIKNIFGAGIIVQDIK